MAERWSLALAGRPLGPLSYGWVEAATLSDGRAGVLKLAPPGPWTTAEIAALGHWAGQGAVEIWQSDAASGALLLERALPGIPLSRVEDDDEATLAAAASMRELWRRPPPSPSSSGESLPFATIADQARGLERLRARFAGGTGPFPTALVERAEAAFAGLLASPAPPLLLHGDLHHDNLLSAGRAPWLAIDPNGVLGEPAAEVAALLRNPRSLWRREANPVERLARRLDLVCDETGLDRARTLRFAFALAVLSAWWSFEDEQGAEEWQLGIALAAALAELEARSGRAS